MSRLTARIGVASTFGFVAASRVAGILREMIIAIVYGFSSSTDLFYQLTALPTYILTFTGGPFTTALAATVNRAGAPSPAAYFPRLRRILIYSGLLSGLLLWCGALLFALFHGRRFEIVYGASLIAPAALFTVLLGLGAAFMNARGLFVRAQGLLFFNNGLFVVLIALGGLFHRHVAAIAPILCGAYLLAAVLGAWLSSRFSQAEVGGVTQSAATIPGFAPALGYASMETCGFIATQFIVLYCASHSAVGTASAAALAQRIANSVQGLIILPATNILMLKIAKNPERQRPIFLQSVTATFGGLALFAFAMIAALGPVVKLIASHGHGRSDNAMLLTALLPSFLIWLIAIGTNAMVARLLFSMGRGRSYTSATLCAYVAANIARMVAFHFGSFSNVVLWGALIELFVVVLLTVWTVLNLRGKTDAAPLSRESEANCGSN